MNREKTKFFLIILLLLIGYVAVIITAYDIQVTDRHRFYKKSSKSSTVVRTVTGKRGAIYDKNGEPLALSEPKLDLMVDPQSIQYKDEMIGVLVNITSLPSQDVKRLLYRKTHYVILKRDVPYAWKLAFKKAYRKAVSKRIGAKRDKRSKKELKKLLAIVNDFNMVRFESGYKRIYPQNSLLSNTLGFVRKSDMVGLDGIEYREREYLNGKKIEIERFKNAIGKQGVREVAKELKNNSGESIYLTIDARIQYIAEEELAKMVEKSGARWGSVTIMNPLDGKILALANYPSYNPAEYQTATPSDRRNYAVANLFEPGSTMKIFSLLAVMNANLIKPGELIFGENGLFRFGGRLIHDHERYEWMTLKDIVVHSSNIGTVKLADRLKRKELYDAFRSFGFGQKSEIDVLGESYTPLRPYKKWYPIDKANIAFGQGLMVNSVQMVRAFATLYNGGVLWSPRLVDHIRDAESGDKIYSSIPKPQKIQFKYNSDKRMIRMLEAVVDEGTAKQARITGVSVGGKTGTAQKYDAALKRYSWKKVVASFIGAVPNENPKMIMMVVIDEPGGREYGGTVAAPVFQAVARRSLPFFGIYLPPENNKKEKKTTVSIESDVTTPILPKESENKQYMQEGFVIVPNLKGMSLQKAALITHSNSLEIQYVGESEAKIVTQSPEAGTVVPKGTVLSFSTEEPVRNYE